MSLPVQPQYTLTLDTAMKSPARIVLLTALLLAVLVAVCEASFFPKKSYEVHHVDLTGHAEETFDGHHDDSWGKKLVWRKRWQRVCRPEWQQVWKKEWVSEW